MSGEASLRDLLPSLWRPEEGDETLLSRFLGATGFALDRAAGQLQHVLRAHWFDCADRALWDAHYQADRAARGLPPANVRDPKDAREIRLYPYVSDLARLCALVGLPPWREPASLREGVEEYRGRVADLLAAYGLGLTTAAALRRLVEAALPEDMGVGPAEQLWPFAIEEPRALRRRRTAITAPAVEEGPLLSPLHRWEPDRAAMGPPTVYLQGVAPAGQVVAATEQPAIEFFTPNRVPMGTALAYDGTLAPGQTLRLTPARRTWLALDGQLHVSAVVNGGNAGADPSVNGPWEAVPGAPLGRVRLLAQGADRTLWLAVEDEGNWSLFRYDGVRCDGVTEGVPEGPYTCLHPRGDAVYLGGAKGLYRCRLFPEQGHPYALTPVPAVTAPVHSLADRPGGALACAADDGLALLGADDTLQARLLEGVPVRATLAQGDQLYVTTERALLLEAGPGRWFRYEGAQLSEDQPDWQPVAPEGLAAAESPLPAVSCLAVTPDGSLWLGTARGLARYRVRDGRTTVLEAFPDLGTGEVLCLMVDERGLLRGAGDDGLVRFDGRDLAQFDFTGKTWRRLGRAESLFPDDGTENGRGHWRYGAGQERWERLEVEQGRFSAQDLPRRGPKSPAVSALLCTPSVCAELGLFDGTQFTASQAVPHDHLRVRVKPEETRIVGGGLPALPCAPGDEGSGGNWRYLQLEPEVLVPPPGRPWWSREGRLVVSSALEEPPRPAHFRDEVSVWVEDDRLSRIVFSYPASARLWLEYPLGPALGVRVRLFKRGSDEVVDPALIERVWQLLVRAKAAGVPLELAVEGAIVKGDSP